MRGWLLSLVFAVSALGQTGGGWKNILPPPSLKGWTRIAIPPTQPLGAKQQWSVDKKNKTLVCAGDQGHDWLRYDQEVTDFVFHAEFRFTKLADESKARYNSGIFVRNNSDGAIWHQAQIGSSSGGYFFGVTRVKGENKRLNFQDKTKPSPVKPAGEWNTIEVRAQGNRMTLWVNGGVASEWNDLEVTKGYLGLEAEGYHIVFRNLKIKKL